MIEFTMTRQGEFSGKLCKATFFTLERQKLAVIGGDVHFQLIDGAVLSSAVRGGAQYAAIHDGQLQNEGSR
jgi:hypothetical protein